MADSTTLRANQIPRDHYSAWYTHYVQACGDLEITLLLEQLLLETLALFKNRSEHWLTHPYAPQKWTPLELLEHIVDSECVFNTRLLAILRGDTNNWPGFDQDVFVRNGQAHLHGVDHQIKRLENVRSSTLLLAQELDVSRWHHFIVADGNKVSAAALLAIIAGHHLHHLQILKERYP